MKRTFYTLLALLISFSSMAQVLTDKMEHPEAIVSDGKFLFVGNFGGEFAPTKKDGDGYIAKLDFDGKIIKKKFITGLSAPKGMCIIGGVLYLTDITVVKGYKLKTGKEVFSLEIPGAKFLNDVVAKNKKTLYVSDSNLAKIFEINPKKGTFKVFAGKDTPLSTNGLWYSKKEKRLYVVGNVGKGRKASIGFYQEGQKYFTKISDRKGSHDGLDELDKEHLIITDWQGTMDNGILIKVNKKTGEITKYPEIQKIEGSADFYFHKKTKTIYIPALVSTKIYKFKL